MFDRESRDALAAQIYADTITRLDSPAWESQEEMFERARMTAQGALKLAIIFMEEAAREHSGA